MSNYIHYKVRDEITYPFPNFNRCNHWGLVQGCSIFSALAMAILQSCTRPATYLSTQKSVFIQIFLHRFDLLTVCRLMMNPCICDEIQHGFIWHLVLYHNMAVRILSTNPEILLSPSRGICGFSLFTTGIFRQHGTKIVLNVVWGCWNEPVMLSGPPFTNMV